MYGSIYKVGNNTSEFNTEVITPQSGYPTFLLRTWELGEINLAPSIDILKETYSERGIFTQVDMTIKIKTLRRTKPRSGI